MGILFIISVVAFLALLWAAFSIARHIRGARRRQRNASQALAQTKNATTQADAQEYGIRLKEQEARVEKASGESVTRTGAVLSEWSSGGYPASGIVGSTFTGRGPKI